MKTLGEKGFSLVAALIFMTVVTIVGLTVASNTTNEEKMARSFRDRDLAFAAAEAALADAELLINGRWRWPPAPLSQYSFEPSCPGGLCNSTLGQALGHAVDLDNFFSATATSAEIGATTLSPAIQGVSAQPRYRIELISTVKTGSLTAPPSTAKAFRITAQARGRMASTLVTLQEVYRPIHDIP